MSANWPATWIFPSRRGYSQAQNDPRLLFGLGGGRTEEVEILWPSGRRQLIADPPPGRYLMVREP